MGLCRDGIINITFADTKCSSCELYDKCSNPDRGTLIDCFDYAIKRIEWSNGHMQT